MKITNNCFNFIGGARSLSSMFFNCFWIFFHHSTALTVIEYFPYLCLIKVSIPDVVVDHSYRIGHLSKEWASNKNCKGIIVRFTTFRPIAMLQRVRSKLKGVKVWLDLKTKSWYDLFSFC